MRGLMDVPPTSLACDAGDAGLADLDTAQKIVQQYHRNGWRATVCRDWIVTEVLFVRAAIVVGLPLIEVMQIYDGSPDDPPPPND